MNALKTVLVVMIMMIGLTLVAEARHGSLSHPTGRMYSDGSAQMTREHSEW